MDHTDMMNTKYKTPWIVALRSGEYKQTSEYLKNNRGFCCLGVLCDVAGATWDANNKALVDGFKSSGLLSYPTLNKFGLTGEQQNELAHLNDSGKTFAEIADHIEATL
jgi:hypothetical protein